MKSKTLVFLTVTIIITLSCAIDADNPSILVFTKTNGYRHGSIEMGVSAIKKLGQKIGFEVIHSEDSMVFNQPLGSFDAIVFLNTTGDILNDFQQAALKEYIEQGGGFVGIHSATDTEYEWPWYNYLVGAYFESHPQGTATATLLVEQVHASTALLPENWEKEDEWYNLRNLASDNVVVLSVDESSYEGGTMGDSHPVSWYKPIEKGRAWYTALGHTSESYGNSIFLDHLAGGIEYAMKK